MLRPHTVGDLDVQAPAAPSILDCVHLDFGNDSCLPSRCEHVRLAALWPAKLALDYGWRPPFRWSTDWDRFRVAHAASAPRCRVSSIAHGWVSTVGVRATVHSAKLFSAPAAAHLTHPIRGGDCCRSAVFDSASSESCARGGNSRLGNRLVYSLPVPSQPLRTRASWACAWRFQCRMRSLTT